jgi:hypothetical protein
MRNVAKIALPANQLRTYTYKRKKERERERERERENMKDQNSFGLKEWKLFEDNPLFLPAT